MKLIVITLENFFDGEAGIINQLLSFGDIVLHIRKPGCKEEDLRKLLSYIDPSHYQKVILHDHFSLADEFQVRGIHLNKRNPYLPANRQLSVSKSCHTFEELNQINDFEYVFLSPVFDSISKEGYKCTFLPEDLLRRKKAGIINKKVIALGGVLPENIRLVKQYGFGGIAILGGLWGSFSADRDFVALFNRFHQYRQNCN